MKSISILILLFVGYLSNAQTASVRELAPGVFYYYGDELQHRSANCVWVVFKDYVVVVDANYPWAAKEILQEIRKTTSKPVRFVLNTHYHHDHTFGNGIFAAAGATIVSTTDAANEMKTLGRKEWNDNYSGQPLDGYTQVFPTMTFDSTLVFDDGTHRVEFIRMAPAHTMGDAVALLPNESILITGDLFVNGNPWGNNVADPDADYDKWLNVLDTLAGWKVRTIVPGHGELATSTTLILQRNYLADMLKQVRQCIKAGKTSDETVRTVNLSTHPGYGANKTSTDRSVRAMYTRLSSGK
ncbi:MBL fold metallo-hydrolase [Chryseolinea sp. T2]|uniref:MBL fold metallo-hydrolase n=1 Tax=Chryseolinea sp. T2 TaxID=3129255 RepID=UPI003078A0BC